MNLFCNMICLKVFNITCIKQWEPQHGQEQPRANGDAVEDERLQRAEQPRSDCDSDREQRHAARDRPRRKITSTNDTRYKNFICE